MIPTPIPSAVPMAANAGHRGLLARAIRALRTFRLCRSRATDSGTSERRALLIKQDLAHLDRNLLRDIGLDRDGL